MNIKSKLLTFIGGAFIILLLATFSVLLILTANKIRINLTSELNSQTESITTQVGDLITSSARSYLMAAGDQADLISKKFFELSKEDVLSPEDSRQYLFETINSFTFLTEGYIYITDENGIIINHPNPGVINTESTINSWLQTLNPDDKSFYTYDYQGRNKLLYRVYNKDLNINICTTAYTSDLLKVIDLDELNKAMNNTNIGTTGYPFLMDSDGVYITHPNEDYLNKSQLNLEDADGNKIVQRIINEGEGSFEYNWLEPNGKIREKFVYFRTDYNSELIIAASGYEEDFYAVVYDIRNIIIVSGVVVISILLLIIYIMSGSITKSIVSFTENLKDVSDGNGDLTKRITLTSKDEIGTMVKYFNNFLSTLQNIIIEIKKSADLTIEIKNEIAYGVDETSAALYEISTNIEGINNQTQYLNNNVKASADSIIKINSNIDDLNNSIDTQSLMLETSTAAITEMISSIDNVSKITTAKQASAKELILRAKEGSEVISNTLNAVQDVSNQLLSIKEMADLISGISSQTNLLAMNAAIEAAHAGDAGKGFAVVADEIRKLAETSSLNSTQITNTLKKVESSILLASNLSNKTSESFGMVNSEIVEIVGALQEIDNSTNELQIGGKDILESITGLEGASNIVKEKSVSIKLESESVRKSMDDTKNITLEVVTAIDEINQGTKGISGSMEGVSTTSYKLKETGENLSDNVNRFKTE